MIPECKLVKHNLFHMFETSTQTTTRNEKSKNRKIFSTKNLLKKSFIVFIILISYVSQAQVNLDSLWGVWNDETKPDTSRAAAMSEIAWNGYLFSQPDSAFYFAQKSFDLAEKINSKKEMASALKIQGISFYIRGDVEMALSYYEKSLATYKEIRDSTSITKVLNNIGLVYIDLSDYAKAHDYYSQSLKISEEISNYNGIASSLNNLGNIYAKQSNYLKALNNYERVLKIFESIHEKKKVAGILNNIGLIYMELKDYPIAMNYFQRYLEVSKEISDKRRIGGAYNNIGLIQMNQKNYSEALDFFDSSYRVREEIHDKKGMSKTLNNIGTVYNQQMMYSQALDFYEQSLKIREEIKDKEGLAKTFNNIGVIFNKQGSYAKAISWCMKGLRISEEINILEERKNACGCLYDAYKALGNNKMALEYHELKMILDDSLQAEETVKRLQQMEFAKQMLADSLRQEEENLRIQIANEREVSKKNRTRNIVLIIALFLLMGAIAIHQRMIRNRRAKKTIEKEKDRSEKLLLNILPSEIAKELKEKGKADPRKFEMVSILFSDFEDFTQLSEKLDAKELVEEINACFKPFDAICAKYGIEKIKTINDTYMASGGLPVPDNDSVKNTVLAGLEMQEFIINRKKTRESEGKVYFEMRVGIHTGSVIAGIVGDTKFQYDIWGDAVNTASRVESSGEAGKVTISVSTYEVLKDNPIFKFQSRGKVKVKGKANMEMWFVEKAT